MTPQSKIFANMHKELLKPLGYRKINNRSERSIEKFHQAVAYCSSFWNSESHYRFTLEVHISHEEYFNLYNPGKAFPGLSERFGALISWRPKCQNSGGQVWWEVSPVTSIEEIQQEVFNTFSTKLLPIIDLTSSVEGLIKFCENEPFHCSFIPHSWSLKKLGLLVEAQQVIEKAVVSGDYKTDFINHWQNKLLG